jgi:hypothetical protein
LGLVSLLRCPGFQLGWTEQKGSLQCVEARVLLMHRLPKRNPDGLEWIQLQVTQKDVAVLFFAGHGINDPNGMFYFLPADADLSACQPGIRSRTSRPR